MSRVKPPECPRCRAPVLPLAHERTGTVAPIDPEPVRGGNITVDPERATYRILPRAELDLSPNRVLHTSHIVTCPLGPVQTKRAGA